MAEQHRSDGLCFDPDTAVMHLSTADPVLRAVIEAVGAFTLRPDPRASPWSYLVRSIVYQQLHGAAAAAIHGRLLDLVCVDGEAGQDQLARGPSRVPDPVKLLETSVDELRAAGVSGGKAAALHDLARHELAGTIPDREAAQALDDAEIERLLVEARGVGPWTVHMLLMFLLGRGDVLPVGDLGVREGMRIAYGLGERPTPRMLAERARPWTPYRSVASWYLWRAVDLAR